MTASDFNTRVIALLEGLLGDAQSDEAYDYVIPLHEAASVVIEQQPEEFLMLVFIRTLREHPEVKFAIQDRSVAKLETVLLDYMPGSLGASVKEITLSLPVPDLFRDDAEKKMWKRIKKMVILCGLSDFVYDEEAATQHQDETSQIVEARIARFNHAYDSFLEQLVIAFPVYEPGSDAPSSSVRQSFHAAIQENPSCAIEAFKTQVLPVVPQIVGFVQENQTEKGVTDALKPFFGDDPTWFKKLPFAEQQGVDEYWAVQIADAENRDALMKAVGQLTLVMSGVDTLIYSPVYTAMRRKAEEIMKREKMTAQSLVDNKASGINFLMELVQELPAATDGKITSQDMETLLMNVMSGNDEFPDVFGDLFSPEMIDPDCIGAVIEIPGIGDLVAPYMAGIEGQMTGSTGTSAFGSAVETPAWVQRD